MFKLKDRIESYQDQSDYKLLNKLPTIIIVNGKSFAKVTSFLEKPYSDKFSECMLSTALKLCSEIEGALFAYLHSDEIVILTRNDQSIETTPWFDNKIQKIASTTSSIATLHFDQCAHKLSLNLLGEPLFSTKVFAVPNIVEAINTMIYKQQQNTLTSIQFACFYELLKKYDKNIVKDMVQGLSFDEKVDLLKQECDVDFNDYPLMYRRGAACYKIPKVVNSVMKNKWYFNDEIPLFAKEQSFLSNIFKMGHDIFRVDEHD